MISLISEHERYELTQIEKDIDKSEIIKYYTFSQNDFDIIQKYRRSYNQLGFIIQLGILRHKGWPMRYMTHIPDIIIFYAAEQISVNPSVFKFYSKRQNTVFEHFKEIKDIYGYNSFTEKEEIIAVDFLNKLYLKSEDSYLLITNCIDKLKSLKIVLPGISRIEEIVSEVKRKNEEIIINTINENITVEQKNKIDDLLKVQDGYNNSILTWIREDKGSSSNNEILDTVKKIEKLDSINLMLNFKEFPNYKIEQFIRLGRRYEPSSLKRFDDKKRHAILSAYLMDLKQCLIDKIITIHDLKMNAIFKKIKKIQEQQVKNHQKLIKESINDYVQFGSTVIKAKEDKKDIDKTIEEEITWIKLKQSVKEAEIVSKKTKKTTLDILNSYYGELRKYTPVLLKTLRFENTSNTCKELVQAVEIIKDLNETKKVKLPDDIEIDFANKKWRNYIDKKDGYEKRHYYEMAVLNELKNKVRSGDVSVSGSKSFKNFEDYLVSEKDWISEKKQTKLTVEKTFGEYFKSRKNKLNDLLTWYSKNYDTLDEIIGEDNKIHLKRLEANTPLEAKELSNNLYKMIPRISLPDIMLEITKLTSLHKHFSHAANQQASEDLSDIKTLIFAIMAIGTNVGLSKMAESLNDISYKQLAHIAEWRLYEENLQSAQSVLTNYQLKEPLSAFWGDGSTSSSDGMRVKSVDSLNANFNHKAGFDKIITIQRFVNDKYSAFYTTATSPGIRDGIQIIDGLLKHRSELKIKEHYTDTAGYTDQVFALTSIMGFNFAPRLRNLPDLKLYMLEKDGFPKMSNLVRGVIKKDLIEKNFENILRLGHSIFEEKVSSSLILSKLGSYARNNSLANALREMGKIEKTIFILKYASDPEFRRRIQIGLNKGEEMNGMARAVFFGRRGQFWEYAFQEQFQKASCLNVLLNAIVIWNTKYLTKAWKVYKYNNPNADENLLKHISPLNWEHINFLGEYSFDKNAEFEDDNLRKLIT